AIFNVFNCRMLEPKVRGLGSPWTCPLVGADVRRLTSIFDCRFSNAECRMPNVLRSRPQCASRSWRCLLSMNLSPLVAADVRRLTLPQRLVGKRSEPRYPPTPCGLRRASLGSYGLVPGGLACSATS